MVTKTKQVVSETLPVKAFEIKKDDYLISDGTFYGGIVSGADDVGGTIEIVLKTRNGTDILHFDFLREFEVIRERKG